MRQKQAPTRAVSFITTGSNASSVNGKPNSAARSVPEGVMNTSKSSSTFGHTKKRDRTHLIAIKNAKEDERRLLKLVESMRASIINLRVNVMNVSKYQKLVGRDYNLVMKLLSSEKHRSHFLLRKARRLVRRSRCLAITQNRAISQASQA